MINDQWLKDYFKGWSNDDLYDRYRELKFFGGNPSEIAMIQQESKRRERESA